MGFTNQTEYLGLPQWVNDDKPSWLVDMNNAFAKIDDNAKKQGDSGTQAETNIEALQNSDAKQNTRLTNLENKQRDLDTDITQLNEDVNQLDNFTGINIPLETKAQNLSEAVNEIVTASIPSVNVNTIIEQIGVRYNGTLGVLMVFTNGEWKNYGEQIINNNLIFDNGTFKDGYGVSTLGSLPSNLPNYDYGGINLRGSAGLSGSVINIDPAETVIQQYGNMNYSGVFFTPNINMSDYTTIRIYNNFIQYSKGANSGGEIRYGGMFIGLTNSPNSSAQLTNMKNYSGNGTYTYNYDVSSTTATTALEVIGGVYAVNRTQSGGNSYSGSMQAQILSVEGIA